MFEEIKYFIQRGKQGYSDRDLWNFDDYLCQIIPPALRQLAKKSYGCPGDLWDKDKVNYECHKWEKILEEIAQGFEAAREIEQSGGCRYHKKLKDGAYIFEYNKERAIQLTEKFNKGIDLLKEYFFNLWD